MRELIEAINELNDTMQDIKYTLRRMSNDIYIGTLPEKDRAGVRKQRIQDLIDSIDSDK